MLLFIYLHTGCVLGIIVHLVCPVCVCVTLVVFTDCQSCTRPISTNPGSMKAGKYGLTRGTRFVACHFEVVAVTDLLWISWWVSGAAGFRVFFYVGAKPSVRVALL